MRTLMTVKLVAGASMLAGSLATTGTPAAASTVPGPPDTAVGDGLSAELIDLGDGARVNSISPDGQWLAGSDDEQHPCVWRIETLEPVCSDTEVGIDNRPEFPSMRWAPDSSAVAFTSDFFRAFREPDVLVLTTDGELTNLTDDGVDEFDIGEPADGVLVDVNPTWSADSAAVIFARDASPGDDDGSSTALMRVEVAGGEPTTLTELPMTGRFLVWMPMTVGADGTLWFTVSSIDPDAEGNGLWRLAPDGATPVEVRPDDLDDDDPASDSLFAATISGVAPDGASVFAYNVVLASQTSGPTTETIYWTVDTATGTATPADWIDLGAGRTSPTLVAAPSDTSFGDSASTLAMPAGPQVYSPDGTQWFGRFVETAGLHQRFVVVDTASGEVVGSLLGERKSSNDPDVDWITTGPAMPQFADNGTVLVQSGAGTAVLFTVGA